MAAAVLTGSFVACSGSGSHVSGAVVTYARGLPPSFPPVTTAATRPVAAWAGPRQIYVVAYGSGSCPHLPSTVYADRHNSVNGKTEQESFGADAYTADLGPTTSTVDLPKGVDVTRPVRVDIDGTVTTLGPR